MKDEEILETNKKLKQALDDLKDFHFDDKPGKAFFLIVTEPDNDNHSVQTKGCILGSSLDIAFIFDVLFDSNPELEKTVQMVLLKRGLDRAGDIITTIEAKKQSGTN